MLKLEEEGSIYVLNFKKSCESETKQKFLFLSCKDGYMKKNYQIKFNQPKQISSEQIKKHQDFDALFASFEQKHPPKRKVSTFRRIMWMGGAIAAATIGVVFWFNRTTVDVTEQYHKEQVAYFEEQPYINPPLENVRPTFASYHSQFNSFPS